MQMNTYCAQACARLVSTIAAGLVPQAYCSLACGGGDGEMTDPFIAPTAGGQAQTEDNILNTSEHFRNFSGMLEEMQLPNGPPSTPIPSNLNGNGKNSSRIGDYPFHINKVQGGNSQYSRPNGMFRYANPHYAGGQVIEYIMGPFETICSGNEGYFTSGGQDFRHSDSVISTDSTFIVAHPTAANRGPPERLYCSHAHNQDSPFGYTAHSTPFTIWGGLTF